MHESLTYGIAHAGFSGLSKFVPHKNVSIN